MVQSVRIEWTECTDRVEEWTEYLLRILRGRDG
jgi:hypothetical protein